MCCRLAGRRPAVVGGVEAVKIAVLAHPPPPSGQQARPSSPRRRPGRGDPGRHAGGREQYTLSAAPRSGSGGNNLIMECAGGLKAHPPPTVISPGSVLTRTLSDTG